METSWSFAIMSQDSIVTVPPEICHIQKFGTSLDMPQNRKKNMLLQQGHILYGNILYPFVGQSNVALRQIPQKS
jgi:hypothetical protein